MKNKLLTSGVFFFVLTLYFSANAQIGLAIETNYVLGISENEVQIWNETYTLKNAHGFEIKAVGVYTFEKAKTDILLKAGMKELYFSGESEERTYSGKTTKLELALGGQYHFNSKLAAGAFIEMANNIDFQDYRSQTSDLFRYSFAAQINYTLLPKLNIFAALCSALSPIENPFIIFNPSNQIRLGVNYKIW